MKSGSHYMYIKNLKRELMSKYLFFTNHSNIFIEKTPTDFSSAE